jgi:hypothetical protein
VWLETSLVPFNRIARGKSIRAAGTIAEYLDATKILARRFVMAET